MYFAAAFPELHWQSSDIPAALPILRQRIAQAGLTPPISLDVDADWPEQQFDAVFSANSLHIMAADSVRNFFPGAASVLASGGKLMVYGPCKYGGDFTTESNARFDVWLKERNPVSGIRDFEWLHELASEQGLRFIEDNPMPANNQLLVWQKD